MSFKNIRWMPASISASLGTAILLLLTACNPGASDAQNIIESRNAELRATISYYEAMQPTMTADTLNVQATMTMMANQINTISEQNRQLTAQLNANAGSQVSSPGSNDTGANTGTDNSGGQTDPNVPVQTQAAPGEPITGASGIVIQSVTLAKGKDGAGCATSPTSSFMTTDEFVYVIAVIRNFTRGTKFVTTWSGGDLSESFDWTSDYGAQQECVHFYINPAELALQAGTYSVVFTAGDAVTPPLTFTVEQAQ